MRVPNTDSCVEVGAGDMEDGSSGLQVRRGSEPTLHQDTLPPQRTVRTYENNYNIATNIDIADHGSFSSRISLPNPCQKHFYIAFFSLVKTVLVD